MRLYKSLQKLWYCSVLYEGFVPAYAVTIKLAHTSLNGDHNQPTFVDGLWVTRKINVQEFAIEINEFCK